MKRLFQFPRLFLIGLAYLFFAMPNFANDCNVSGFQIVSSGVNQYMVNAYSGATYLWSPTGSLTIISGQGTNQVTVSGCGTLYVTRDVPGYHCYDSIEVCTQPPTCTPTFQVMAPNWNQGGETCPNNFLELGIIQECLGTVDYEWSIFGATVQSQTPDGRYIFVTASPFVGAGLSFRVRAVFADGSKSDWYSLNGIVVDCNGQGGGQL